MLTRRRVLLKSLRFHWRSHLGVVLGAAIGSAALIGALVVGDSVRETLKARALARIGGVDLALASGDRLFAQDIAERLRPRMPEASPSVGAVGERIATLRLQGSASRQDGQARARHVNVYGATPEFFSMAPRSAEFTREMRSHMARQPRTPLPGPNGPTDPDLARLFRLNQDYISRPAPGKILVNRALADQLRVSVGDTVVLRMGKPSALSQDAAMSPRSDSTAALRLEIEDILGPEDLGDFSLSISQRPPLNAFVNLAQLQSAVGVEGRANLLLVTQASRAQTDRSLSRRLRAYEWVRRNQSWLPAVIADPLSRRLSRIPWRPPQPAETRANLEHMAAELDRVWRLDDAEIEVRVVEQAQTATGGEFILPSIEVSTRRVFLDPPVVDAALTPRASLLNNRRDRPNDGQEGLLEASYVTNGAPVLTYLANAITHGDRLTPYSMIAAADVPWTPPGMADDEIIVTDWLAEDLGLSRGDRVDVVYFDPEAGAQLIERTNQFRVAGIVPLRGIHADRTLMPDFPGLANAETTSDWDAGFPLKHTIREKDEAYWQQHRGTPKAFVTYETGRRLWGNRFGNATAIRFPVPEQGFPAPFKRVVEENLLANLRPADLGLVFQPVREQAFAAATSGQDFGGLFLGFSFFLIAAALLLMALLFQFGLEQRLPEVGTFLALGFQRATVRRLWIGEGALLALLGGILGVIGGVIYARAMIHGLTTIWSDAVAGANLDFHATPQSLALGFVASSLVAAITIAWTLRRQFSRPARALLSRDLGEGRLLQRSRGRLIAIIAAALAAGLVLWAIATRQTASAGVFFGAGALCVVAGIAFASWILTRLQPAATGAAPSDALTPSGLALRGATRRRSRSLATISLLASGAFLIAAIGAFRMDAHQDPWRRSSGTGGFAFIGETSLPVSQDLNTAHGLEFFALSPEDAPGVSFVPLRVLEGDDASCLNLNRAQRPRILGVHPEDLARRNAFRFAALAKGIDVTNGWLALKASAARSQTPAEDAVPEIPAIGDAASIQWALGKKIGDTLELADAQGRPFRLRLVGGVANSILQGNLIIDEARFRRLFPDVAGYRLFLIDAPTNNLDAVAATFSRAMEDVGLELTPPTTRLAQFNAVQNTYLTTFQILGGLGLLLGSAGLGVVVLRNVLERRGELALLTAVGFRRNQLSRWVLWEHASLLMAGLVIGVISAAIAVLPSMLSPTAELPAASLLWTLAGVLALGMITTWLATRASMRGRLLDALRGE